MILSFNFQMQRGKPIWVVEGSSAHAHRKHCSSALRVVTGVEHPATVDGGGVLPALEFRIAVAKLAIADCPPLLVLTARFLIAGVFMLGAAAIYGMKLRLDRRDFLLFAIPGSPNQRPISG